MEYTYYYTYKVTCTEGSFKDKIYYGQHKTNDLNDGYKGSGTLLRNYYKKYPDAYEFEILNFYNNQDELNAAEYELIEPHLNKEYCLNLRDGGNQGILSDDTKKKISVSRTGKCTGTYNPMYGKHFSDEHRQKLSESHKGKPGSFTGKHHSDETKEKLSQYKGDKASMYGKHFSDEHRQKLSNSNKGKHNHFGKNNPNYGNHKLKGKHWRINPITSKREFY